MKSIRFNALLNIVYTISNIIFPVITFPYVSRILLADGMGKVSFFTSISNYAVMVASLGISTYGIRATAKVGHDKKKLSKTFAELLIINLVMTVIVLAILALSIPLVEKFRDDTALLLVNFCLIFCSALGVNWLYSGLEQYAYITKRTLLFKFISLVLVFALVHQRSDYIIYAVIMAFSTSGSYILNFWHARKFIDFKKLDRLDFKQHFKPMLFLFASTLAVNIYTNLDTVMLGFISGDREVGLYTVAVKVKWLLLSVVNSISAVLLPRLSLYLSEDKTKEFNRILKKSISIICILSIPLTMFFIIEAKDCILILGGENYVDATVCMQIIMPILLISGFSNITGNQILIPMGKDACFMKAVVTGSLVDLFLNILLMPYYASTGAAIATLIAECVQMSVQLGYSFTYVRKNIQLFSLVKAFMAAIIASLCILLLKNFIFLKQFNYTLNALLNLIIYAITYFIIYVIIMFATREQYSIEILKECFKVFRKRY